MSRVRSMALGSLMVLPLLTTEERRDLQRDWSELQEDRRKLYRERLELERELGDGVRRY